MQQFKLHILYDLFEGASGGGNHFLGALREEWKKKGCYTEDWKSADIILINSIQIGQELKFFTALRASFKNKTVIHRIAGPFRGYRPNDAIRDAAVYLGNALFSHGNIFQSERSRQANYKEGMQKIPHEAIFINAPDPRYFFKKEKSNIDFSKKEKIKIVAMSWSANKLKGFDAIEWLDKNLDFTRYSFTFIGNTPISFTNISHIPPLPPQKIAEQLKKHDIFFFPSKIEACSNAILQGLHCGLPTIAYNGSSNPEIVGKQGVLFKNPEEIPSLLEKLVQNAPPPYYKSHLPNMAEVAELYRMFCYDTHAQRLSKKIPTLGLGKKLLKTLKLGTFLTRVKVWKK
jgi:glycosyltransferase involved in cell wall biosynthesis